MASTETILYDDARHGQGYQVIETTYEGRPARVLYSGERQAAQSGIALDGDPELLFDYNQRFLELTDGRRPERVLLIGGGAYTLPMRLLADFPGMTIDVVERDSGLQTIARRFFGLKLSKRLRIFHDDGRAYLSANDRPYGMILMDVFEHTSVPDAFSTCEAARQYARNLAPHGLLAANILSAYAGRGAETLRRHVTAYAAGFGRVDVFPAGPSLSMRVMQNLVVTAQPQADAPEPHLRYAAFPPLAPEPADEAHDDKTR